MRFFHLLRNIPGKRWTARVAALGGLCWTLTAALFWAAWHLKHPLLHFWRPWETPLLIASGMGGSLFWLGRKGREQGLPGRRLLALALLGVAAITIFREIEFMTLRAGVMNDEAALRRLGAHFIVGVDDFDSVEPLAERGLIGGIYLTRRNARQTTPAALAMRINRLQALRARAGLPPLIVAADQEGGQVAHLSPLLPRQAPLSSLLAGPPEALRERARHYGQTQSSGLSSIGVNLNFGPVVDLRPANAVPGDRLTNIAVRAIAADPGTVSEVAEAYIDGLKSGGVRATLKHFPGLGRVRRDTHLNPAHLRETPAELAADWAPFRRIAGTPGTAIMLGHVTLDAVDARHAASHSSAVVQGILRENWGYDGILITDDLNMGAVYRHGIGRVAGEALAAGVDLILVSYDPDQFYRALQGAALAWKKGEIPNARLLASERRLTDFAVRQPSSAPEAPDGNVKIVFPEPAPPQNAPVDSRPAAGQPALARQLCQRRQRRNPGSVHRLAGRRGLRNLLLPLG